MQWKCCTQYASKFGKLSSGHRTGKGQFSFQSQRKDIPKNDHYCTIELISHASKVMLKILQARLQQYMNRELPDVQAGFRKAEEPEIKLPTFAGSSKKQESSRKTSISALLTMPKPLTVLEWVAISLSNACMHAKSLQLCPTLCDPIDGSPPGSPVHRIL